MKIATVGYLLGFSCLRRKSGTLDNANPTGVLFCIDISCRACDHWHAIVDSKLTASSIGDVVVPFAATGEHDVVAPN